MDETSLNQAISSGAAIVEDAQEPQTTESATASTSLEQFIPLLQQLQSVQRYLSVAPTFVPMTWQEQIQFAYTGGTYYLYLYVNNQWKSIKISASSTGAVTGVSGAMSGGGIVTITNAAILTTSIIIFSRNSAAGTLGDVSIFGGGPSTGSVTLASSSSTDRSTFNYAIYN